MQSNTQSLTQANAPLTADKVVVIMRNYMRIRVQFHTNKDLRRLVCSALTISRRVKSTLTRGYEIEQIACYTAQTEGPETIFHTGAGFLERLRKLFKDQGYRVVVKELKSYSQEELYAHLTDDEFLSKLHLREEQKSIIKAVDENHFGQFVAATGSGKTFTIRTLCRYYPNARFLITTYSLKLLNEIYKTLLLETNLRVGMFSSQKHDVNARIQLCAIDSLHHFAKANFDIMLIDERHEACTSRRIQSVLQVRARRCYGFSANENDRSDKADKWSEAVCGPVRFRATYQSSVDAKSVVPIEIEWRSYDRSPIIMDSSHPAFNRRLIWRNDERNQAIADAAQDYADKGQVLVFVKTVEHIYALRRFLKCPVVHAKQNPDNWERLKRFKLIDSTEQQPSADQAEWVKNEFKKGKLRIVICNTVWKRGIDIPTLGYVVMAHAGSSTEDLIQVAGRVSRRADGKTSGRVIDFVDTFNSSLHHRAQTRNKIYKAQGWKIVTDLKP